MEMNENANSTQQPMQQTVIVQQQEQRKSNGMGTAGFVLALIGFFLSWIPILGWVIWFLGVLFSAIGVFRTPRGMAIAGLCISFIGLIFLITVAGMLSTWLSTLL